MVLALARKGTSPSVYFSFYMCFQAHSNSSSHFFFSFILKFVLGSFAFSCNKTLFRKINSVCHKNNKLFKAKFSIFYKNFNTMRFSHLKSA